MLDVLLKVDGKEYAGWKTISVSRSIENISGEFDLSVSDRWGSLQVPWQILEGQECTLTVGTETLITGYVDTRKISFDAESHTFQVTGRDKSADLVDSSAVLDVWEFSGQSADAIMRAILKPWGIPLTLGPGVVLPPPPGKFSISPGDSCFEVIERLCRINGVLSMPDGKGGIFITQFGSARIDTPLLEGANLKAVDATYSHAARYYHYLVAGQHPGTDTLNGPAAASILAESFDLSIRKSRTLMVRPEGNVTIALAKQRAEWEATVRAARAATVEATVQGWESSAGVLWALNKLVPIKSPMAGIDSDMLITQVSMTLDDSSGTLTKLSLARPDAFKPEPEIGKKGKKSADGATQPWDIADPEDGSGDDTTDGSE